MDATVAYRWQRRGNVRGAGVFLASLLACSLLSAQAQASSCGRHAVLHVDAIFSELLTSGDAPTRGVGSRADLAEILRDGQAPCHGPHCSKAPAETAAPAQAAAIPLYEWACVDALASMLRSTPEPGFVDAGDAGGSPIHRPESPDRPPRPRSLDA